MDIKQQLSKAISLLANSVRLVGHSSRRANCLWTSVFSLSLNWSIYVSSLYFKLDLILWNSAHYATAE
jgi:hypothetical protein